MTTPKKAILAIQIGKDIWVSNLGSVLCVMGIILSLPWFFFYAMGKNLPIDASIFYYSHMIPSIVDILFVVAILISVIGIRLSNVKHWIDRELSFSTEKISFKWFEEEIELERTRILRITYKKKRFSSYNLIKIKTIGIKQFELRAKQSDCNKLFHTFEDILYFDSPIGIEKVDEM
ncbi:MAG: hypothetical protein AAFQ20_02820 [Bacteroidota bacterium]